jgi:ubiquinone/menaquinone biosynthesis C-methylase UbiE
VGATGRCVPRSRDYSSIQAAFTTGEEEKMPGPVVATKQMIEQIFDASAGSYDRVGPSLFSGFGRRLVEHLPIVPGLDILDVATGTGAVVLPAAHKVGPEGRVIGTDLSAGILDEARKAARAEGLANVELHKMDAEHLQFADQSFDVVTCAFALFLFPDQDAALREIYRVLKPGGHIGVSIFGKTPSAFAPAWPILMQQFEAYGVGVRMPGPLAYAPEETEALLNRFGFHSVHLYPETNDVVYATEDEWWALLLTLGPRPTILGMDDETRARFKEEYFGKLRPTFSRDGLHLPASVVYATAHR